MWQEVHVACAGCLKRRRLSGDFLTVAWKSMQHAYTCCGYSLTVIGDEHWQAAVYAASTQMQCCILGQTCQLVGAIQITWCSSTAQGLKCMQQECSVSVLYDTVCIWQFWIILTNSVFKTALTLKISCQSQELHWCISVLCALMLILFVPQGSWPFHKTLTLARALGCFVCHLSIGFVQRFHAD